MKTKEEISKLIEQEGVEFIRLQFTDMFGNLKNLAVTPSQLNKVLTGGYAVDDSVLFDDEYFLNQELYLKPDLDTFVILPWRPQQGKVGKFLCDVCYEDGTEFELSPRTILKKVLQIAEKKGYHFSVEPECDFFLFHTDENGIPTTITHEQAGYMDVGPVDCGENARRDMVLTLEEMGFEIESSLHEKAPAQHEISIKEAEPMRIADSIMTFKFAVRSIAKRFGLYATFMPKPRSDAAGSGMHLKIAINHADKRELAESFLGGIKTHIGAVCAVTNPLVNSYKRFVADGIKQEKIARIRKYSGEDVKVELRFPDPTANPYLAIAICLAVGMDGMDQKESANQEICVPENLKQAVSDLRANNMIQQTIGEEFVSIYTNAKQREWDNYSRQVSDWEVNNYLYKW